MNKAMQQQRTYYARKELGLCVRCGMNIDNPGKYVMCEECRAKAKARMDPETREWRREYQRKYREDVKEVITRISLAAQSLMEASELKSQYHTVSAEHKCWTCVWSRWHGDRFFCPLVGCVKGGTH